jgi:hypothetical protein
MPFSVASILVWGLGVPSFILTVRFKKCRSLDSLLMKSRFGFSATALRRRTSTGSSSSFYLKILIIYRAIFVGNQPIPIQALSLVTLFLLLACTLVSG